MNITHRNNRYYLRTYIGFVNGKRKYKWQPLTKELLSSQELASNIVNARRNEDENKAASYAKSIDAFIAKAYRTSVRRAKEYGVDHDITTDFLMDLARSNGFRCAVTGIKFDLRQLKERHGRPFAPSIDRIVAGGGYTTANVRLVCVIANYAMNQFGEHILDVMLHSLLEFKKSQGRDAEVDGITSRRLFC